MKKPHKQLALKYYNENNTKCWWYSHGKWVEETNPDWSPDKILAVSIEEPAPLDIEWRTIAGQMSPVPLKSLNFQDKFFYFDILLDVVISRNYTGHGSDKILIMRGECFSTREAALLNRLAWLRLQESAE